MLALREYTAEADGNVISFGLYLIIKQVLNQLKCQEITKVIVIHHGEAMNICTMCQFIQCETSHWMSDNFDLMMPLDEQSRDQQTHWDPSNEYLPEMSWRFMW